MNKKKKLTFVNGEIEIFALFAGPREDARNAAPRSAVARHRFVESQFVQSFTSKAGQTQLVRRPCLYSRSKRYIDEKEIQKLGLVNNKSRILPTRFRCQTGLARHLFSFPDVAGRHCNERRHLNRIYFSFCNVKRRKTQDKILIKKKTK